MKPVCIAVAVLSLAVNATFLSAEEEKSPELQVLDRFVGKWKETVVMNPAAWTPERTTVSNESMRKWILDGKMVENAGTSPNGKFLHLMTFDPKSKQYRQWYFDKYNLSGTTHYGKWDAKSESFTFQMKDEDGNLSVDKVHFVNKDKFTWTYVAKDRSGKLLLDMEGTVERIK